MPEYLILRLDAPMISFGGAAIDHLRGTLDFPPRSMVTGLIANALGWRHRDAERLSALQRRVRHAARRDRAGERFVDYQTVDLGQPFLVGTNWTTWGERDERTGAFSQGTHIRYRHYLADSVYTLAVSLEPGNQLPTLHEVEAALRKPARPLFLGRKCCLPASPLVLDRLAAASLRSALATVPRAPRADSGRLETWWPEEDAGDGTPLDVVEIAEDRDWLNQIHTGTSRIARGFVDPLEVS